MDARTGSTAASVFPAPVGATISRLRPSIMEGMASVWSLLSLVIPPRSAIEVRSSETRKRTHTIAYGLRMYSEVDQDCLKGGWRGTGCDLSHSSPNRACMADKVLSSFPSVFQKESA